MPLATPDEAIWRWQVPDPVAIGEVEAPDGTRIILRRHGNPDGPRLVLSHGNGLATDLYYPFWSLLEDRFDLVLYDLRNHGWNPPGEPRNHNVATFAADDEHVLRGIARHFGEKPQIGVYHSISAVVALNHRTPGGGYEALVLFDPPIYTPGDDRFGTEVLWQKAARATRLRAERFESREALSRAMRRMPVFSRLPSGVVDLFAQTTLRPAPDGKGYQTCCPRECEARVFDHAFAYSLEPDAADCRCPVKVIGADPAGPYAFLPSLDLNRLAGIDYDFVPETTHFLQLENPDACVALMLDFFERHGLV